MRDSCESRINFLLFISYSVDRLTSCDVIYGQEACDKRYCKADSDHKKELSYAEVKQSNVDTLRIHIAVGKYYSRNRRCRCENEVDESDYSRLAEEYLEYVGGTCADCSENAYLTLLVGNRGGDKVHKEKSGEYCKSNAYPKSDYREYFYKSLKFERVFITAFCIEN